MARNKDKFMQVGEQVREYVTLTEALSWIAWRTLLDAATIKGGLCSDPSRQTTIEEAARQFSFAAGNGRLKARGRYVTDADGGDPTRVGYTDDIHVNQFNDFQQFDLDRERLQYRPASGNRVIGTWIVPMIVTAPDGATRSVQSRMGTVSASYGRAFQSYAEVKEKNRPSYSVGYEAIEVLRADLIKEFPRDTKQTTVVKRGRPRKLDHDAVTARAETLRNMQPSISIRSAAASIAHEFGPSPHTGNDWDARGVEKIIARIFQNKGDK